MKAIQLMLLMFLPVFTSAQKPMPICTCPKTMYESAGTKPAKIFHFSNNRSIALYGYKDTGIIKGKTLYSEFVLAECGAKKIIDFWGAVQICDVTFARDTLYVKTLYNFPVGKDMKPKYLPWTIERIFFSGGKSVRDLTINPAIPRYTAAQISKVLDLYRHTPNTNEDATVDLADKLLISAMSGSKKAKYLLVKFPKKFTTLDGATAEGYDTILSMLKLWEKTHRGSGTTSDAD
jgi:hypothetical protein